MRGWPDAPEWLHAAAKREGWAQHEARCRKLCEQWRAYELEQAHESGRVSIHVWEREGLKRWRAASWLSADDKTPYLAALSRLRYELGRQDEDDREREQEAKRAMPEGP